MRYLMMRVTNVIYYYIHFATTINNVNVIDVNNVKVIDIQ